MSSTQIPDYYRGDRRNKITPPNLNNDCTIPEHIVCARGKKTKFTSVSLNPDKIRSFGDTLYILLYGVLKGDRHELIEHANVLKLLKKIAKGKDEKQKDLALRAIPRAKKTLEGLVDWKFNIPSSIDKSKLISWAEKKVQKYFKRV